MRKYKRLIEYIFFIYVLKEKASCDELCSTGADPRTVCDLQKTTLKVRSPRRFY